ncbi:MAG TPA: hypothetical protein VMW20_07225 [Candidatus Nanoarchaeia archaeon]|nr:hypothetical protein [Candidatus Nanoarchaeia archaeon]
MKHITIVILLLLAHVSQAQAGAGTQMYLQGDLDWLAPIANGIVIMAVIAWILHKLFGKK